MQLPSQACTHAESPWQQPVRAETWAHASPLPAAGCGKNDERGKLLFGVLCDGTFTLLRVLCFYLQPYMADKEFFASVAQRPVMPYQSTCVRLIATVRTLGSWGHRGVCGAGARVLGVP